MKIELKKLKISLALSEETTAFTADVVVNGKVVGYAKNNGHGGSTDYNAYGNTTEEIKANRKVLQDAEAYCESLPKRKSELYQFEYDMNLEAFIDDLVYEEQRKKEDEKFKKKLLKLQETKLLFGVPNSDKVSMLGFNQSIAIIMSTPQGRFQLANIIKREMKTLKEGETVLNTNIDFKLPEFTGIKINEKL